METFQNGISSAQLKIEKRKINRCKCKNQKAKTTVPTVQTQTPSEGDFQHIFMPPKCGASNGAEARNDVEHTLWEVDLSVRTRKMRKRETKGGNIINAAMNFGVAVVFAVARCLSACIPACHDRPIAIHADVFLGALVPQGGTMGHICTRTDTHY